MENESEHQSLSEGQYSEVTLQKDLESPISPELAQPLDVPVPEGEAPVGQEDVPQDDAPQEQPAVTLPDGARVGDYIITQRLGQGGMCEVYKGIDPALARFVAIKVMLGHLRTEEALKDFLEEARVIAKMRHSNIVPIYSVGELNGIPWLAMEFIDGPNLEMFLHMHRPLTLSEAKDFIRQACEALAYAVKCNVIHLDIKPANFILDPRGTIMLADFGLARRVSEVASGALDHQELLGTPAFASPEHILQRKPDLRTDIYSLGVTIFNMITGVYPFEDEDTDKVCQMHLTEPFPSEKLKSYDVPDGWCRFIKKMMEKNPDDRFQSYEEILSALETIDRFSHGRLEIQAEISDKRHTLPRSGGDPGDLFYMVPHEMVNQGEDLFRFETPMTSKSVMDALDKRWPVLRMNNLAGRLLYFQDHPEGDQDINDMLWALAKIPEYRQTLDGIAHFMATDSGEEPKTDDEKLYFIGLDRTRNLAITSRGMLEDWQGDRLLNHHNFWEYSIYSGLIAGLLVDSLQIKSTGFEFACAMLQDMGKLILMELFPTKVIALWYKAYQKCVPLEELEMEYFGLTHFDIAGEWLNRNKFHKLIASSVLCQNKPERCFELVADSRSLLRAASFNKEDVNRLMLVVACAKSLAKELQLGYCGSPYLEPTPWMEQKNTIELLKLNKSADAISKEDFQLFFTETCLSLPDLPVTQLAFAERAVISREARLKGTQNTVQKAVRKEKLLGADGGL